MGRDFVSELQGTAAAIPIPRAVATSPAVARRMTGGGDGYGYQRIYEWVAYPAEQPEETYKDDPNDPEETEKTRPARWWNPRLIGFRAKVLVNPLGGEVRKEVNLRLQYMYGQLAEVDYFAEIAPRVIAWEYVLINDDGTREPVPPPADPDGGANAFYQLPNDLMLWLRDEVQNAHIPKAPTPAGKRAGITATPVDSPESDDPAPELPPS